MTNQFSYDRGSAIFQYDLTATIQASIKDYMARGTEGIPNDLLIPTKFNTVPLHVNLYHRRWRLWGKSDMNRLAVGDQDLIKLLMVPNSVECNLSGCKYLNTVIIERPVSLCYHFFWKLNPIEFGTYNLEGDGR